MLTQDKKISIQEYFSPGETIPAKIQNDFYIPEQAVLEEFNRKYAIVHTNTTSILFEKPDGGYVLDTRQSLINFHENDCFLDSNGKPQNKARFWLKHPERRTFTNLVFDPAKPGHYNSNYNIFSGYSVKPENKDCSFYWSHVREVICSGNEKYYKYVRKWMASVLQKPKLLATALVLRGLQGTGKNKFVEYFGNIFGRYFLTINSLDHLVGRFNSHLQNAFLIFANEALWGGNKKETGLLKSIITDPTIIIEGKGKDAFEINNCRHLIIASNEDWAIHMDLDDRRFFPLDVSDIHQGDIAYFAELDRQMSVGGVQGLMYDLLQEDLSMFDPRIMPLNDYGFDMKLKSSSSAVLYLYEALKHGAWNFIESANSWEWGDIPSRKLYGLYLKWCRFEVHRNESNANFGKIFCKMLSIRKRRFLINEKREWIYEIPVLEQCRRDFESFVKQSKEIWEE